MESNPEAPAGRVTLVGGGPGDPDLITVAGLAALRQADVVLYDHLAPLPLLAEVPEGSLLIDVGKLPRGASTPQEEINRLLVGHALAGRRVVRLKGGDPFVFGRGGEEVLACRAAGVAVRVIPGVSAATTAPGLAAVPLTHRGLSQGFTVVSAHVGPDAPGSTLDWDALARSGTTLVVLMGVATLPDVAAGLIRRGMATDTPAVVVEKAGHPDCRVVRSRLGDLPEAVAAAGIGTPATTIIGPVAGLELGPLSGPEPS